MPFHQYERGDPAGAWWSRPGADGGERDGLLVHHRRERRTTRTAGEAGRSWRPPQQIPATIELQQDFTATTVLVRPVAGRFEENSFLVVDVTGYVQDFGRLPLSPRTIPFTTENLPEQQGALTVHFDANDPDDDAFTSADVNTARSPSRAQGWLIFAGDGDNGTANPGPGASCDVNGPSGRWRTGRDQYRENCLFRTTFSPDTDITLNTGSTANWYPNETDGSTASVWEFASFTIVDGVTVRITGINPAIILVDGDVQIYEGGTLLLRGANGTAGAPGQGTIPRAAPAQGGPGGAGNCGGGDGGPGSAGRTAGSTGRTAARATAARTTRPARSTTPP